VQVQIGAERSDQLYQMVQVVIRPLHHVLIKCDVAVSRVDTDVRTGNGIEFAEPDEGVCSLMHMVVVAALRKPQPSLT
jgi:hypothetical protein